MVDFNRSSVRIGQLIICIYGVASTPLTGLFDLANPRANQNTSGFLPVERAWLDRLEAAGYVDTFRHFYPDLAGQYTWWLMAARARERNIGWRIDYFFAALEVMARVVDAFILPEVTGSDHCPAGIRLEV